MLSSCRFPQIVAGEITLHHGSFGTIFFMIILFNPFMGPPLFFLNFIWVLLICPFLIILCAFVACFEWKGGGEGEVLVRDGERRSRSFKGW